MFYTTIKPKITQFFIAISIAILTTGFLRLQLFSGLPEGDGGFYSFASQFIFNTLTNGENLEGPLFFYQFIMAWVYGFEVNQFILLRLIDGLVAVAASVILFKVILKESGGMFFTVILMVSLLILMNDIEVIAYGFRNSIWAAYIPLFSALLIWQNANKEDTYSFYLIGGLISLGILLREPFLPFFLLAGISILIAYGWRVLIKYLIGSAVVGFSVLAVILMFRGWDLLELINSYLYLGSGAKDYDFLKSGFAKFFGFKSLQTNWLIYSTSLIFLIYLLKLYCADKQSVNMNRLIFWLMLALVPLIEPMLKIGLTYHFAQCLPGLAGLSAMGWKHLMTQESKKINQSSIIIIGLMSLLVILPTVNKTIIKSNYIYSPSDAISWAQSPDSFRGEQMIERSQYLKVAAKVYGLTREDSTLVVTGHMQGIFPLTGLLPPTFKLNDLKTLYASIDYNKNKLIEILLKHRPTVIITSHLSSRLMSPYEKDLPDIIERTNLYTKVGVIKHNLELNYGYKAGLIYRLIDFK